MLNKTKIALSLALVLATASAAIAAPKHPVQKKTTPVVRAVPADVYNSFGWVRSIEQRMLRFIDDPASPGG
jgi:hypothetical protein